MKENNKNNTGIAFVGGIAGSYVGEKIGLHESIKDYIEKISAFPIKRSKGEKIKVSKNIRYKIFEYKPTILQSGLSCSDTQQE